ncbi:MAG: hypothetical protein DRP57_05120 [Spirochaetes bacterium]|nr:MAG: hypothetical protein DRP57_05120 [Spirochaetota bacterium]
MNDKPEIIYYKSFICPRCIPTSRFLKNLKAQHPEIKITEIEILTNMKKTIKEGIHGIPVIAIGNKRYSGVPSIGEVLELLGIPSNN